MKQKCFALDLKDDPELIEAYKQSHKPGGVWPEITKSIRDAGITDMQIFLVGNRLFMIMTVSDDFCAETKSKNDANSLTVHMWESLMSTYQKPLPWAESGQKWLEMECIFSLQEHD